MYGCIEIKDVICLSKNNMTLSCKHAQRIYERTAEKHASKFKRVIEYDIIN